MKSRNKFVCLTEWNKLKEGFFLRIDFVHEGRRATLSRSRDIYTFIKERLLRALSFHTQNCASESRQTETYHMLWMKLKKAVLGLVCLMDDEDCGSRNQWGDIKLSPFPKQLFPSFRVYHWSVKHWGGSADTVDSTDREHDCTRWGLSVTLWFFCSHWEPLFVSIIIFESTVSYKLTCYKTVPQGSGSHRESQVQNVMNQSVALSLGCTSVNPFQWWQSTDLLKIKPSESIIGPHFGVFFHVQAIILCYVHKHVVSSRSFIPTSM